MTKYKRLITQAIAIVAVLALSASPIGAQDPAAAAATDQELVQAIIFGTGSAVPDELRSPAGEPAFELLRAQSELAAELLASDPVRTEEALAKVRSEDPFLAAEGIVAVANLAMDLSFDDSPLVGSQSGYAFIVLGPAIFFVAFAIALAVSYAGAFSVAFSAVNSAIWIGPGSNSSTGALLERMAAAYVRN